ncbi:MAG: Gfo/Idh/MocA family protein, partial [Myxococcota bacterium]
CWREVPGAELVAVASATTERASSFAKRFGVAAVHDDAESLIASRELDAVDLCVPNALHRPLAVEAAMAGKHVICTKPLTAYVGQDLPANATDADVSARDRGRMAAVAEADGLAMLAAADQSGVVLCYGENWLYAPAFLRAESLLIQAGGPLLEMRGWEAHSGSHSPYAKAWRHTGGGALLRLGAHPIGAMLHLKRVEGMRRLGRPIRVAEVSAETADLTRTEGFDPSSSPLASGWQDVENWGCVVLRFEDGSRGVAYGSDNQLGGMQSRLELSAARCRVECNLSPNDQLRAYSPDGDVLGDAYLIEKQSTTAGWSTPMVGEDWSSGQLAMCRAFAEAIQSGVAPAADGWLGLEVVRVLYAAYCAAAEGRRVPLELG